MHARFATALDSISVSAIRKTPYDGTCEDLFSYVERLLVEACGDDVAGRLHTARSRNDIDMTMYRLRQREFIVGLIDASVDLRAVLIDLAARHRDTLFAAHTHTQPAQPTTLAHYLLGVIEQLERDGARLRAAYASTNRCPLGSCAITGTGFPIDRQLTSDLLGFDGPTGNTYGSIATVDYLLESASAAAVLTAGLGRVRPGPAPVVHGGVRVSATGGGLRPIQHDHAAEAQSGGARTCARDWQQGARPGVGDHGERPQHARSATSSTPRTICSRSSRRCFAMRLER